jgi:hypothetical protein
MEFAPTLLAFATRLEMTCTIRSRSQSTPVTSAPTASQRAALFSHNRFKRPDRFGDEPGRILDLFLDRQTTGVDLSEIAQISHQARHVLCGPLDRLGTLPYAIGVRILDVQSPHARVCRRLGRDRWCTSPRSPAPRGERCFSTFPDGPGQLITRHINDRHHISLLFPSAATQHGARPLLRDLDVLHRNVSASESCRLGRSHRSRIARAISKRNAPLILKPKERAECRDWRGLLTDRELLNRG